MERHFFVWMLIAALAAGCSKSKPDAGQQAKVTAPKAHTVERPVEEAPVESTSDAAATLPPAEPVPDFASAETLRSPFQPFDSGPDFAAAPTEREPQFQPAPPASEDLNPLRFAPPPRIPDEPLVENPLRDFDSEPRIRSAPRMAASAAPRMRTFGAADFPGGDSQDPNPAGGSALPESSGESEARSFSITARAAAPDAAPPSAHAMTAEPGMAEPPAAGPAGEPLDVPRAPESSGSALTVLPQPPVVTPGAFDVVKVFYGTDRQPIEPPQESVAVQAVRFLPLGISVLITLALGLIAVASRRGAVWGLVVCGVLVSSGLGYQAFSGTLTAVRQADKEGLVYTSDRSLGGQVQLGICEVTIPKTHKTGELEAPSILRLEIKEDPNKHVVLTKTERLADEQFYATLRERVAASPNKELFVFVHGFNVSFEDAARRTAQIHKDLGFDGAPIFFSWPANTRFVLTYPADESNVAWSAAHLKQFLLDVSRNSDARSVNLIAHSMGNRALTAALKELQLELREESRLFNQVILAAPDIDADEFRLSIAPAMTRTANRITLYASANDEALAASQLLHRGPRAGDAGRGLVVVQGIDTIDVTAIDTSPWGHTYYGSSDPVLQDLAQLLLRAAAPSERTWLAQHEAGGLPYWIFQPISTARTNSSELR